MADVAFHPHGGSWGSGPRVIIAAPATSITMQELATKIRDWEDEPNSFRHEVAEPDGIQGKVDFGATPGVSFTGIVLALAGAWQLQFEDRAGPSLTICEVKGGTLKLTNGDGDPVFAASDFVYAFGGQNADPAAVGLEEIRRDVKTILGLSG